jgi:hypothetical protein
VSVPLPFLVNPLQETLEERLENGGLLREEERKILLQLARGETTLASLRKQVKSMHAAEKAKWIAQCVFLHEAINPPGKREAAVHDAMESYGVDRSYVYRVLGKLGPEQQTRMRIGAAMSVAVRTGRTPRHVLSTEEAVSVDRYLLEFMR